MNVQGERTNTFRGRNIDAILDFENLSTYEFMAIRKNKEL